MADQAGRLGLGQPSGLSALEEIAWRIGRPSIAFELNFNVAQYIDMAALETGTQVAAFTMPNACVGVLRYLGNGCANPSDLSSVRWRLYIDDTQVQGYSGFLGSMGPVDQPFNIDIPMPVGGSTINIRADNLINAPVLGVVARLQGIYWPQGSLPRNLIPGGRT